MTDDELIEYVVKFIFTHTELWKRDSLEDDFKLSIIPNEPKYYEHKFPYKYETWVEAIKNSLQKEEKGKTMNENTNALDTRESIPALEGVPEFLARDPKDLEVQVERTQEDLEAVDPQNTVH